MIVSHQRRFIFVHNPKCAGSSFRDVVGVHHDNAIPFWGIEHDGYFQRDMDFAHLRLWELAALYPHLFAHFEEYESLAFVRNPLHRFNSAVVEHFHQYRPEARLLEQPGPVQREIVEDFVLNDLSIRRILSDFRYVHFSPQSWFINFGRVRKVRKLVPLLPGGAFWTQGLKALGLPDTPMRALNVKPAALESVRDSAVVYSFVSDFYWQDFKMLSESRVLRPLVELGQLPQSSQAIRRPVIGGEPSKTKKISTLAYTAIKVKLKAKPMTRVPLIRLRNALSAKLSG